MASKQLSHFPTSQVPRWGTLFGHKEQVAVLRLHAASTSHVTDAAYSCLRGVYVRYGTKNARTSENSVTAKFAESPFHALGCINLESASQNSSGIHRRVLYSISPGRGRMGRTDRGF